MGKLSVPGKACKEIACDIMHIKICFKSIGDSTSKLLEKSMSQCDLFLEILEQKGININTIHFSRTEISHDVYADNSEITADREIELRLPFDMNTLNCITEIIKEKDFTVELDVSFVYSNIIELHDQLIKEAVLDSKKKAEMIAEAMEQKVIGINTLTVGDRYNNYEASPRHDHDAARRRRPERHGARRARRSLRQARRLGQRGGLC
ncbi:MAG: SIMPL domain-containing protein, partial [Clostridia bacterium]|nr:SIMPL domain-containing protein [Clostridia bacterium]